MLYNKSSGERKYTASLSDLVTWLKEQDPLKKYEYGDSRACLAAQYRASLGEEYEMPLISLFFPNLNIFTLQLERIGWGGFGSDRTFGGALVRAEAMQASKFKRWLW